MSNKLEYYGKRMKKIFEQPGKSKKKGLLQNRKPVGAATSRPLPFGTER